MLYPYLLVLPGLTQQEDGVVHLGSGGWRLHRAFGIGS